MTAEAALKAWFNGAAAAALLLGVAPVALADEAPREAFRVCADPNYMPFSNEAGEGLENRIAAVLADGLSLPIQYEWFPQRMGFIRNTLRAQNVNGEHKCDVVMGVPTGFELAITTRPYYRSTYALVYVKGRGLDDVSSAAELAALPGERKAKLRFGLAERNPGTVWMAKHGMLDRITRAYASQSGDPGVEPNALEKRDLLDGEIDLTVLWGPIAGYFARENPNVVVVPIESEPGVRFHFSISLGVRFPDKAWREQLQGLLDANQGAIEAVLREFQVPLVDEHGKLL